MSMASKLARFSVILGAGAAALLALPAAAKDFTFDEKTNKQIAAKLKIPVYFALPASARATLPKDIKTTDKLIDFKHPDAKGAAGDVGLRLVVVKRSGMAKRLGQSGLVKTGDLLLTFRSEWGGAGAYPNIQMGISHTGVAYVGKDGVVRNLDNPLNEEYLGAGMRGDLTSEHYRTLNFIHVIRPRDLTDAQRANILAWAQKLNSSAKKIYPSQIAFNQDYNKPKFRPGRSLDFVRQFGQIALGEQTAQSKPLDLFCSEFVWSLLALRDCDPAKTAADFKGSRVPSCVNDPMRPMRATGNVVPNYGRGSYSGLADGPLLVISALKLPDADRTKVVQTVFAENPGGLAKMSVGHRTLAEEMQPRFAPLQSYYTGITGRLWQNWRARLIGSGFNWAGIAENYSPTSFLINTLLPADNKNRTMDYVATIMIE
jgi:hypothetical protein